MNLAVYLSGAVAVTAALLMLASPLLAHAFLYLVVSLLGVAVAFFALGAPFAGAMEAIVYAAAIILLFVFVVAYCTIFKSRERGDQGTRRWGKPDHWVGPIVLAAVLIGQMVWLLSQSSDSLRVGQGAAESGPSLLGPWGLGLELALLLLMTALMGAFHLGQALLAEEGGEAIAADGARPLELRARDPLHVRATRFAGPA